jgi:hypothetical protein
MASITTVPAGAASTGTAPRAVSGFMVPYELKPTGQGEGDDGMGDGLFAVTRIAKGTCMGQYLPGVNVRVHKG